MKQMQPALLLIGLLLVACSTTPVVVPPSIDRAAQLASRGDHAGAAAMYGQLAAVNPPPTGIELSLSAVREWLAAQQPEAALTALPALPPSADAALTLERGLLEVQVQLARQQAAEAWRVAAALPEPKAAADAARYHALRQKAALAAGRPVDLIKATQSLETGSRDEAQRLQMRRALLTQLQQLAARGVKLDTQSVRDPVVRGWLDLAAVGIATSRSPLSAGRETAAWQKRYPGHPGNSIVTTEISSPQTSATLNGLSGLPVALLLPLSGRNAASAAQVRDGFQAALAQLPDAQRPLLKLYDTATTGGVTAALAAAQSDGAALLVGPLTRDEAVAAAAANLRGTPLLLLNSLPPGQSSSASTWQFSLSPEDEARQVARRALSLNEKRAIVLAPTSDWGTRVADAFRAELTAGGGTVLVQASYDPVQSEFTAPITAALRIDESRARHKRIQEIAGGKLNFETRRRADVDFIFAAGQPLALRQIRPQLRFFYAGDLPTYMTSDGFDPDPGANRDIDGVIFPDMPWLLQETGIVADIRSATQPLWGQSGTQAPRLFAFGFDAGQLALALRDPRWQWPLAGVTGRLAPDAERRLRRDLDWAQIRNGKPQALSPVATR